MRCAGALYLTVGLGLESSARRSTSLPASSAEIGMCVAAGRKPFTEGLGLEDVGVKVDKRGRIEVDDHFCTSVEVPPRTCQITVSVLSHAVVCGPCAEHLRLVQPLQAVACRPSRHVPSG